jgi:hypothetical protein
MVLAGGSSSPARLVRCDTRQAVCHFPSLTFPRRHYSMDYPYTEKQSGTTTFSRDPALIQN